MCPEKSQPTSQPFLNTDPHSYQKQLFTGIHTAQISYRIAIHPDHWRNSSAFPQYSTYRHNHICKISKRHMNCSLGTLAIPEIPTSKTYSYHHN